jgi:transcriptional regulator with XRE-family HTH domain
VKFRDKRILDSFARNFKAIRLKKNLTQEELAYQSDVSLSQIARIETGRINPTLCTLVVLAKALKVDASELVDFN